MAVEFRKNAARDTLYNLAVENGIEVAEDADRAEIIAALEAYNAQEAAQGDGEGNTPAPAAEGAEGAESGAEGDPDGGDNPDTGDGGGNDPQDGAESTQDDADGAEDAPQYDLFVYVGPTLPRGRLKENAVFRGFMEDVTAYLADVLEEYPQAARLIVPANRLAAFSAKVKTPGNIYHKHYTDIVSAMRNHKEV